MNIIIKYLSCFVFIFSLPSVYQIIIGQYFDNSISINVSDVVMEETTNSRRDKPVIVGDRFDNPWPTWTPPSYMNVPKVLWSKDNTNVPDEEELNRTLPIVSPNFNIESDKLAITWIGHSTLVIHLDNITILTDPIFSSRASFTQLIGPKRYRNAACLIKDLPQIDAVVISHNHYDHLDYDSVKEINDRFGDELYWFVPKQLAKWMNDVGCVNVIELSWWQNASLPHRPDISFVFTPAQHWSKRTLTDTNYALWGSWSVLGPKHKFFFAGDTGYCSVFKQIGDEFGPFDVSAIPIGAYEPRSFLEPQHVDPSGAVQIHLDVKSKFSVGIHWGTFRFGREYYLEPPEKLKNALKDANVDENLFITLNHGETKLINV